MAELEGSLSERELLEWMAYYQLEPFGEERADLRSAMVVQMLANINRDKKKQPQPFKVADFMPDFEAASVEPADKMDPKHLKARLIGAFGPRVKIKKRKRDAG